MTSRWIILWAGLAVMAVMVISCAEQYEASRDRDYDNVPLAWRDMTLFITRALEAVPNRIAVDERQSGLRESVRQYANDQKSLYSGVVDDGNTLRILVGDRGAAVDLSFIPCGDCDALVVLLQARTRDGQVFRVSTVALQKVGGTVKAETIVHSVGWIANDSAE